MGEPLNPVIGNVVTLPLEHVPADQVVDGRPTTGTQVIGSVRDVEVGIWELTEGTVRDTEVDEIFIVLSGSGRVDFEDGRTIDLSPGIAVHLHDGQRTTWTITETLRKIYVA